MTQLDGYRELTISVPRSVADFQRARKLENDALPCTAWDLKREALIASGLVDERRLRREEATPRLR